ncbi:substrate-binding domain-containing protein [Glycomyces paridis]|uniref:substrate-binding domain-containing protein n=1 Tax=Glycomyces paridis TaxID=2126555 RepID=UPI00195B4E9B|nr:substrate-binding domain-containing protein [Glycomyces paridis]
MKSHRLGRRRKKGGSRLPVAPWIVITLVCVLVASGLTWGFMTLLRSGCSGSVYRVTVAAAPSIAAAVDDAAQEWEATQPEVEGECVGVEVQEVSAAAASRGILGVWDQKSLGPPPIAWVPDSQAWASWVGSSEATAGYVSSDPVVLGQATSVLAVPESTADALGWLGGQPPSWADVLDAALAGDVDLAAANPRTSTEGLVAMLNATSDGEGGFSEEALASYTAAIEAGSVADDASEQLAAYAESGEAGQVFTTLGYQVDNFNATSGMEEQLVPVTPSGSSVAAVATYLVLGGTSWVSESDASIAGRFGSFLAGAVADGSFSAIELTPAEDGAAALAQATPEAVGQAVRSWQEGRQDLNVLFLVDRSSRMGEETTDYGGESDVSVADAAIRMAVDMVEDMESTSRAGLWEFGVGADGDANWRAVTDQAEMSDGNREALRNDLWAVSENEEYEGTSPLYGALEAAYGYMGEHAADGSVNVVVVLTNNVEDTASPPTVGETAETLASMAGAATVYTVGFGDANADNLALLAEATGGAYVEAPSEGGVLEAIGAP